ncbi:sporulation protein YqfD [Bacillus sp. MRMR6]|uniref:sporulation protein YqfD n=1 Tax=Bacillus sp. MRMR6 TaxID=1928617 RepID=UPI000950D2D2|nr:sporulation protein YqfD [Bacillus sp. MRMR6]OLS41647.1 sporulation protein YqfD [Bacillus sp. MRMR6]
MKNQWVDFFYGKVTVKVTGKGIERFLNSLIRNNLHIWNVKRHGTETITFTMKLQDALKIRYYAKQRECTVSFLRRSGMPFLFKRLLKNSGFVAGAVLFLVIILILSNVIWGIEVRGAKPATEYQIHKELDKMGVKIGKVQFFVDNVEAIQRQLTNNVGNLTWVGVELRGTTYHLQVVEKKEPDEQEQLSPQNLVAKKKAVIANMYIETGQKLVKINQHVEEGQILVSGVIGKEGQTEEVGAKGEVWGETWYMSHVEQPLQTDFKVFDGREKQKHFILIGSYEIPVWGFGKPEFTEFEKERNVQQIQFLKWKLPISYGNETLRASEKITRTYTRKEAEEIALNLAKKEIKSGLDEDAIIKDEKILHKEMKNGKVILDIHFKIIENIAIGKPIPKETLE